MKCKTCEDRGEIGGILQDGTYQTDPCPDCRPGRPDISEFITYKHEDTPYHRDQLWSKCIEWIRNNDTGEVRKYETEVIIDNGYPFTWNWEEGNFSCDCNRELDWLRAGNEIKKNEMPDTKCGDSKYSVNLQNPNTNKFFYVEFDSPFSTN